METPAADAALLILIDKTPCPIAALDLRGRLLHANQAFLSLWRYRELREVRGRDLRVFWAHRHEAEEILSALGAGGTWSGEAVARRSDETYFEARVTAWRADQPPGYLFFSAKDVTHERQLDALQDGQNRCLEMIATGKPLRVVLSELIRLIEGQSQSLACAVMLLNRDQASFEVVATPEMPGFFLEMLDGMPATPDGSPCGAALHRREPVFVTNLEEDPLCVAWRCQGREFGVQACWSTPIFATDGSALGTFIMFCGETRLPTTTERRLIEIATHIARIAIERECNEEALRESEEKFRQFTENLDKVFWMYDPRREVRLYVSPAFEKIWGRPPAVLFEDGDPFLETVHVEDRERLRRAFVACGEGVPMDVEYRIVRPDGSVRWIWDRGFPIVNEAGSVCRVRGLAEDITERKRTEQALHESEKLASTGRMAARIAHEINNPLAGIKNAFLLIKDAVPSDHPYYDYVGRIDQEIDRIARIVRYMYSLYKPRNATPTQFAVEDIVRDVVMLLRPAARERGVGFNLEVRETGKIVVQVEDFLRQVLFNIVSNAVEVSPSGGTVRVALRTYSSEFAIDVSDEGPGIDDAIRDRVFEPFFSTKTGRGDEGMGLGLSVSKSLVEIMGGTLVFREGDERGTTFSITLPCVLPTSAE